MEQIKQRFAFDGIPASSFGATLLKGWSCSRSKTGATFLQPKSGGTLNWLDDDAVIKKLKMTIAIQGRNRFETSANRSKIEAALSGHAIEITMPDGMFYKSILNQIGTPSFYNNTICKVEYTFDCIQHGALAKADVPVGGGMFVDGTAPEMACKITCTVSANADAYQIAGVTWSNVQAGDVLVLDGIKSLALRNDANDFGSTNLVTWPVLAPGLNMLLAPDAMVVEYYPIWM